MSLNLLWKSNELRLMKVLPRWILPAISWVGSVSSRWGNANPDQKWAPISITMQAFQERLFIEIIYIGGFFEPVRAPRSAFVHFPSLPSALEVFWLLLNFYWVRRVFAAGWKPNYPPYSFFLYILFTMEVRAGGGEVGGGTERNLFRRSASLRKVPLSFRWVLWVLESKVAPRAGSLG